MSKKTGVVVALVGMCALSLVLASCGNSSNRPTGLLYVVSQVETNISSLAIDLNNGDLSQIGSNLPTTCPTAPCGLSLTITLTADGNTAYVLDQGAPDAITSMSATCLTPPCGVLPAIYPYTVNSDGSLSAPGTPVTWGNQEDNDAAVALVLDSAVGFAFTINHGTIPSPQNCPHDPTDPNTDPNDACPSISVFKAGSGSLSLVGKPFRLSRIPTSLNAITFTNPAGLTETLLFVTSNVDLTVNHNDNEMSVFSVDSSGNLTEQQNSPYTTPANPTAVVAVNTNPVAQNTGGVFVYVGTQTGSESGAVGSFALCIQPTSGTVSCTQADVTNNLLLPLATTTMTSCQDPVATQVDPTNSFLYIACNGSNNVYAFRMVTASGALTALTPPLVPTGGNPVALAMHPNFNAGAEFLFVSNNTASSISSFNVAVTTGMLSGPNTVLFLPGEPYGIAAR